MDKWKDAELEKMRAGGNRLAKEFLSSQPDWQVPAHAFIRELLLQNIIWRTNWPFEIRVRILPCVLVSGFFSQI
jgi:hypothetical protein